MSTDKSRATHWTYVQEYRRCKRPCSTCSKGPGHGPYWYAKRKVDGKVKSRYIGKKLKKEYEDERTDDEV